MPNATEQPVPIQVDTLSNAPGPSSSPGGGIRTIVMPVLVNGVMTPVQVQVVAVADGNGNIVDSFTPDPMERLILQELREIRKLMAVFLGAPPIFEPLPIQESDPNVY